MVFAEMSGGVMSRELGLCTLVLCMGKEMKILLTILKVHEIGIYFLLLFVERYY